MDRTDELRPWRDAMAAVLQEHADVLVCRDERHPTLPEGALVTRWYVVAEWVGTDAMPYLIHHGDERGAVWQHIGLLRTAALDVEGDAYGGPMLLDDDDE